MGRAVDGGPMVTGYTKMDSRAQILTSIDDPMGVYLEEVDTREMGGQLVNALAMNYLVCLLHSPD